MKRYKRDEVERTGENSMITEATEGTSRWRIKPEGRQKPEKYNAGETPRRGKSEQCDQGEERSTIQRQKSSGISITRSSKYHLHAGPDQLLLGMESKK